MLFDFPKNYCAESLKSIYKVSEVRLLWVVQCVMPRSMVERSKVRYFSVYCVESCLQSTNIGFRKMRRIQEHISCYVSEFYFIGLISLMGKIAWIFFSGIPLSPI